MINSFILVDLVINIWQATAEPGTRIFHVSHLSIPVTTNSNLSKTNSSRTGVSALVDPNRPFTGVRIQLVGKWIRKG